MTNDTAAPRLTHLDHDADGFPGGAKKPPKAPPKAEDYVWIVSRAAGLHKLAAPESAAALRAGARLATDRDLKIAGVER